MQGGMMLPENLVRSNTPMIPTRENVSEVVAKDPKFSGVVPLSRRMANAFDKMQEKVDVDKYCPEYIVRNKDKFKEWII